jgi:uncharacterized protein
MSVKESGPAIQHVWEDYATKTDFAKTWRLHGYVALLRAHNNMKPLLLILIRCYQICLSPFFGGQCRFYPTCSVYAAEAVDSHGALKGSWLAMRRLLRCHPWHPGGVDPVPERKDDQ